MKTRYHFSTAAASLCIALCFGPLAVLHASSGIVSQLPLPTNAYVGRAVVTQSWTLVGSQETSYATSRGEIIPSAGEVLVYSNATGKLVRRLRSPLPFPYAGMGRCIAASGDVVVVSDGEISVRAFNCATGAHLWRADLTAYLIAGLAIDSGRVLVGRQDTNFIRSAVLNAVTGQVMSMHHAFVDGVDFPGRAVAISGPWTAVGSPRSSVVNLANAGSVIVRNTDGFEYALAAPDAADGHQFGESVAFSGTSLYVGCALNKRVYHFDVRTGALVGTVQPPSPSVMGFGQELCASGHLLLISSADGAWLHDRQTGGVSALFAETKSTTGPVTRGGSLCGSFAAAPAGNQMFRAVGVAGGRLNERVIALTKTAAGGLTGPKFTSFLDATVNTVGSSFVCAKIAGSGVNVANDAGVWAGAGGMTSLMVREGTLIGNVKAGTPFRPFHSVDGSTHYSFVRSSTGAVGLWKQVGGTLTPFLMPGGSLLIAGEPVTPKIAKVHGAGAVQNTAAIANLSLKAGGTINLKNDSIIARQGLVAASDAREGEASGLSGALHGQISPRVAATSSRMVFSSFLTGRPTNSNAAVFNKVISGSKVAVMEKGQSPIGTNGQFPDAMVSSFIGEAVSAGVTVMRGTYKTAAFTADGIWSYNHGTTASHSVAWARGQVPFLATGVTWKRFVKTFATTDGTILFLAQITGPGVTTANDVGFWRCNLGSNAPVLLVREGQVLPGSGGAILSVIQQVDAGADGSWTLLAGLGRSPASQNQILLGGNISVDSQFAVVARKGTYVDRSQGPSLLLGFGLPTNNTDAAGMGTTGQGRLVEAGAILHRAIFKDGTELVVSGIWGY
jgi:hypothetical protein